MCILNFGTSPCLIFNCPTSQEKLCHLSAFLLCICWIYHRMWKLLFALWFWMRMWIFVHIYKIETVQVFLKEATQALVLCLMAGFFFLCVFSEPVIKGKFEPEKRIVAPHWKLSICFDHMWTLLIDPDKSWKAGFCLLQCRYCRWGRVIKRQGIGFYQGKGSYQLGSKQSNSGRWHAGSRLWSF